MREPGVANRDPIVQQLCGPSRCDHFACAVTDGEGNRWPVGAESRIIARAVLRICAGDREKERSGQEPEESRSVRIALQLSESHESHPLGSSLVPPDASVKEGGLRG